MKRYLLFFLITLSCHMAPGQGVGGNGVPGAGSGSGSIPATSNLLKGTGSAGSSTAAVLGTDYTSIGAVTPAQFGAFGDGVRVQVGCNATATNTTVTCGGTSFTSADVGKQFWIPGAGAAGVAEQTTIASVTNSTTVVVASAPSTSVTGSQVIYGHDDAAAIQSCFNYSSAHQVQCFLPVGGNTIGVSLEGYLISSAGLQIMTRMNATGTSGVEGTNIFCEINGDCISLEAGPDDGVTFDNIEIWADASLPNSRGIDLNAAEGQGVAFGGLFNSQMTNVQVENTAQECLWMNGGGGAGYTFNLPNQYITFNQFNCWGPKQPHPANLIRASGQEVQILFLNGAVNGTTGISSTDYSYYPNALVAIDPLTSGLNDAPADMKFFGFTIEVGTLGLFINQASNIHYDNSYLEQDLTGIEAENAYGLTFNGNHIANSGTVTGVAYFPLQTTASFRDNTIIADSNHTVAALAVCTNNSNMIDFVGNTSPVTTTSGCATAQIGPTTSTLNVTGGQTVYVNGTATTITTISAPAISPGKTLTLYAGSSPGFTLAAGGNINLGGLASPLTIPSGSSVVLTLMDLGPSWLVTSGPQIGGLSSNCSGGACTLQLSPLSAPVTAPGFFPQSGAAGPYSTFFDDFYTGANMASDPIGSPTGDTCSPSDTYTDNNHPGNMLLTSGTGGTGTGIVCGLVSENPSVTSANTSLGWTWETAVYVPVLPGTTAAAYQAGLAHTPNANPWTTGIGFYLSSSNGVVNDWYCRYNSTSIDSGVAATVAWTRLTMVNDGTNVHWYIGGAQVCGTGVAIASIPSTTQYPAVWSATALSATSVTMAYDYINWQRVVSR